MSIPSSYTNGSIGGGSSPSGDVKFTYLGFTQTKNSQSLITKITYQGTKQKLINERDHNSNWAIGTWNNDYGRLQTIDIEQDQGPFWHATLNFNRALNNGITISYGDEGAPQQSNLDISMMSMPLQKARLYDYRWNHALIATTSSATATTPGDQHNAPVGFTQLNNLLASLGQQYAYNMRWTEKMAFTIYNKSKSDEWKGKLKLQWLDDPSVTPDRGLAEWKEQNAQNKPLPKNRQWAVVYYPQKPGVDHWEQTIFTITETGKYTSHLSCAWAIRKSGTLAFPDLGDYGIQMYYFPQLYNAQSSDTPSCYWKNDGGTIEFDGKYYNATARYSFSWDPTGWDRQLYGLYKSWDQYLTKSKNNSTTYTGDVVKRANSSDILHPIFNTQGNVSNPILP